MKKYTTDFTVGKVTPALIKFATPLFLTSLLQVFYSMVDMIIVGHTGGEVGLSAVAIGCDVTNLLAFVAMGFAAAGQVLISQLIGSGKKNEVSGFIGTMCAFLTISAVVFTVAGFFTRDLLLRLMNTPAESYEEALGYSTVCIFGMVFIYGYNAASAILRGMGDSKHPFIFIAVAAFAVVACIIPNAIPVIKTDKIIDNTSDFSFVVTIIKFTSYFICLNFFKEMLQKCYQQIKFKSH